MTNYFQYINNIEDLRKEYLRLTKQFHPDVNPNGAEEMKFINAQYDEAFPKLKDIHKNTREDSNENPTYTASKASCEAPSDFINIINELLKMEGVELELCGRWLWMDGNTFKNKDKLKALGCRYAAKKKRWSWHFEKDDSGHNRGTKSMIDIRLKYGSETFRKEDRMMIS